MKKGNFCDSEDWVKKNDPRIYKFESGIENYIKKFDKFDPELIGPHLGKIYQDF